MENDHANSNIMAQCQLQTETTSLVPLNSSAQGISALRGATSRLLQASVQMVFQFLSSVSLSSSTFSHL